MTASALADAAGCSRTTMQERVRRLGLRPAGFVKEIHEGRTCRASVYLPDKRLFHFTIKQMRAEGCVSTADVRGKLGTSNELAQQFLRDIGIEPIRSNFWIMWRVRMTDAELLRAWCRWRAERQRGWTKQSNANAPEDEQPDWLPTLPDGDARRLVEDERRWKARRGQQVTADVDGRKWTGELLEYSMVSVTLKVRGRVKMWLKKDGVKLEEATDGD